MQFLLKVLEVKLGNTRLFKHQLNKSRKKGFKRVYKNKQVFSDKARNGIHGMKWRNTNMSCLILFQREGF